MALQRYFSIACVAGAIACSGQPALAQDAPPLRLDLNIPALRLDVYEGDRVIRSYPVSVGKPGYDTPDGEFTIDHAEWNPWWRPPPGRDWTRGKRDTPPGPNNPMGRVKLFFEPLYFLHGTPEAESIGTPASHGCVRMLNRDVVELARLLHERAGATLPVEQIDAVLRSGNTRHSRFRAPVPLVIRYDPVVVADGELRIYPDLYRRNRIHAEAVYQALMQAGYDPTPVDRSAVAQVLERAKGSKAVYRIGLREAFGAGLVALSAQGSALRE
jgi:murein L,D-transpeptidase YcbB/YkuD